MHPPLPTPLTPNAVDRWYTVAVDELRGEGSPAAVCEAAKQALIAKFRETYPDQDVPAYIQNLGIPQNADLGESS